jgi:mono/diheme cytochrome c family protein
MSKRLLLVPLAVLTACAEPAGDCELATQHVSDCYGDEIASAFADSCTPDPAQTAQSEQCVPPDAEGKGDLFSTPILTPAVEQFKYGSIGADKMGIPLPILKALPIVCRDMLPPGADPLHQPLAAFGFIYEANHDLPIGFSSRRLPLIGTTLVGTTCSTCHTSTVRETAASPRTMYFGAPNIRLDLEGYNNFLLGCIGDQSRFNTTNLLRAFDQLGVYGFDRLLAYGSNLIRSFTSTLQKQIDSVVTDGPWGPGRDDAIGLSGAILLGPQYQPTIAAPVDFPSVWNQNARKGHALHWDGAAGSALERNVLVAVGAGTPKNGVPLESIAAIQNWLDVLPAPHYPFAIDATRATRGAQLFQARCNSCHGGARTWQVIPLAEIQTDPNRVTAVTQVAIDAINRMSGTGWAFDNFHKTDGYLTGLLDGIWLRAPYLHNGSVPTLRDLLSPPAQRPKTFYRGNDTYDQAAVGFVSNLAKEGTTTFMQFDASLGGNGNGGHDYGTDLTAADRDALLEYLKTL